MADAAHIRGPQRLIRMQEVCDKCGGVDTFRSLTVIRGVCYVRCRVCGRHATRVTVPRKGQAACREAE